MSIMDAINNYADERAAESVQGLYPAEFCLWLIKEQHPFYFNVRRGDLMSLDDDNDNECSIAEIYDYYLKHKEQ